MFRRSLSKLAGAALCAIVSLAGCGGGGGGGGGSSSASSSSGDVYVTWSYSCPSATVGKAYGCAPSFSSSQGIDKNFTATGLPPGLTLHAKEGSFSGTPTLAGEFYYTITLTAKDVSGSLSRSGYLSVSGASMSVTYAPPNGKVGEPYSYTPTTSPAGIQTTYAIASIPPGLDLDTSTGKLSGTPTKTGIFNMVINVTAPNYVAVLAHATVQISAGTSPGESSSSSSGGSTVPMPMVTWSFDTLDNPQQDSVQQLSLNSATSSPTNPAAFSLAQNKAGALSAINLDQSTTSNYWRIACTTVESSFPQFNVFPSSNISIETMIKLNNLPDSTANGNTTLVRRYSDNFGYQLFINKDSKSIGFQINNQVLQSTEALLTNTWYHIVATYDGSHMRLYLNGQELGASPVAQTGGILAPFTSCDFKVAGETTSAPSRNLSGVMDHLAIYGVALTQADVNSRYQSY